MPNLNGRSRGLLRRGLTTSLRSASSSEERDSLELVSSQHAYWRERER